MLLNDQLVLGVGRHLRIVADTHLRIGGHRPAIRVSERDLALTRALQLLKQLHLPSPALLKGCEFIGQVLGPPAARRVLLGIGPVQSGQVVGQALIRRLDQLGQLLTGEVAVRAVDRLEPGPVNGDQLSAEQIQLATEKNKLPEDGLERMAGCPYGNQQWS